MAEINNKKNKVKTVLENGYEVTEDGSIIIPPDENYCNNCHAWLDKDDKYCAECGTKRGEGEFVPSYNDGIILYGPQTAFFYKCKKCKHIWRKVGIFDGDFGHFCPKCGTPKPVCYYESSEGTLDASFLFINEPTLYKKIKYRIKKIKQKISNIFKKEKYNVRK